MKTKVRPFKVLLLALLLVLSLASASWADLFVYFNQPQALTIAYNLGTDTASGANITMQPFTIGTDVITGASLTFGFVNGDGALLVTRGTQVLFSGDISDATIIPITIGGVLRYYQIAGSVDPSKVGLPLYTFDFGQLNVTFKPGGSFNGGYFQTFGESKTPIPGAAWLLGTGLFGLIAVRRRRKS